MGPLEEEDSEYPHGAIPSKMPDHRQTVDLIRRIEWKGQRAPGVAQAHCCCSVSQVDRGGKGGWRIGHQGKDGDQFSLISLRWAGMRSEHVLEIGEGQGREWMQTMLVHPHPAGTGA
jgi:hypothetical protein